MVHIPRGRQKFSCDLPAERGRFASALTLCNGANDISLQVFDVENTVLCRRTFTLFYKSAFREWNETVFIAFVLAIIIRSLVLQAFWIPTGSMENTLLGEGHNVRTGALERAGDRILVNKFAYVADLTLDGRLPFLPKIWFSLPKRGDIVVFKYPDKILTNPPRDFIKRVVGLPGEHINITDGVVHVDGAALTEPYIKEPPYSDFETTVPPDSLFVMGDNRNNSADSRFWGPMPLGNLKGQAVFLYWPFRRIGPIHSYEHLPVTAEAVPSASH
ncbi:MAG: signal peptidase I [Candidatus Riflebacteria bacterium]|nr:signal peptidase I [Candidatus Riflebacteria bacterium]